jgi:hypothetical protein
VIDVVAREHSLTWDEVVRWNVFKFKHRLDYIKHVQKKKAEDLRRMRVKR